MEELILQLNEKFQKVGFLPALIVIFVVGTYVFWYESSRVAKDKGSLFDQWFLSAVFMGIWGRASYIIANWDSFRDLNFFWLPYERYGNQVYLFRLLPWKFLSFWDGGFLFTGLASSFLLFSFIYVTFIKKWHWKEMLVPVISAQGLMISMTFTVYGVFVESSKIFLFGLSLIVIIVLFLVQNRLMRYLGKKNYILMTVWTILLFLYISFIFVNGSYMDYEGVSVNMLTDIDWANIVILMISGVATALLYYLDSSKPNVIIESYSPVRTVVIEKNKAIKMRKV